jgi:hypothetical protein
VVQDNGSGGGGGGQNKWHKTKQGVVVQQDKTSGTRLNKCKKWWLRYNTKTKETSGGGGKTQNKRKEVIRPLVLLSATIFHI